ncbi:hypothetical protein [Caulobacter sp. NIBR2454]|uniref:hypothetical protein n=1 Tax=Caulobacter sp. NIBR2454 TaxID=3015996 RepID=UPI0022B6A9F3|nr:hypothetical protein [Caulobacter sp. NIBR2454]
MPRNRYSIGKPYGRVLVARVTRVVIRPGQHHFRLHGLGGPGNASTDIIDAEDVPDFEGDEAWFEVQQVSAKPWPFWRALRQVDPNAPVARRWGHARIE